MTITPKRDTTVGEFTFKAGQSYDVNFTMYEKIVQAGAMKTDDVKPQIESAQFADSESENEPQPQRTTRARSRKKID